MLIETLLPPLSFEMHKKSAAGQAEPKKHGEHISKCANQKLVPGLHSAVFRHLLFIKKLFLFLLKEPGELEERHKSNTEGLQTMNDNQSHGVQPL